MRSAESSPVRLAPVAAGWAAAVTAVAVAGAIATDTSSDWYRDLNKPSWQPPGAFATALTWTIASRN
jgi:translocator protein